MLLRLVYLCEPQARLAEGYPLYKGSISNQLKQTDRQVGTQHEIFKSKRAPSLVHWHRSSIKPYHVSFPADTLCSLVEVFFHAMVKHADATNIIF